MMHSTPTTWESMPPPRQAHADAPGVFQDLGWQLLDNPPAAEADPLPITTTYALAHADFGVALLDLAAKPAPDPVERLRRRLEAVDFAAAFPGDLPIVYRALEEKDLWRLAGILDHAFAEQPPIDIEAPGWIDLVRRSLVLAPVASAPVLVPASAPALPLALPPALPLALPPALPPASTPAGVEPAATAPSVTPAPAVPSVEVTSADRWLTAPRTDKPLASGNLRLAGIAAVLTLCGGVAAWQSLGSSDPSTPQALPARSEREQIAARLAATAPPAIDPSVVPAGAVPASTAEPPPAEPSGTWGQTEPSRRGPITLGPPLFRDAENSPQSTAAVPPPAPAYEQGRGRRMTAETRRPEVLSPSLATRGDPEPALRRSGSAQEGRSAGILPATPQQQRGDEYQPGPGRYARAPRNIPAELAQDKASGEFRPLSRDSLDGSEPVGSQSTRIVVHHDYSSGDIAAHLIRQAASPGATVEVRAVGATPANPVVRYFHNNDRDAAEQLVRRLGPGWRVQDFTHFSPKPTNSMLEVWVPGRGGR